MSEGEGELAVKEERKSKNFHCTIAYRRRSNQVLGLQLDDGWKMDPLRIKVAFLSHFSKSLGHKDGENILSVPLDRLQKLLDNDNDDLIRPFSLPDLEEALAPMDSFKASGPDGINIGVLKAIWKYVKQDFNNSLISSIPLVVFLLDATPHSLH